MTDEDAQRSARTRAKIMDGLARAERALFTRPPPKFARAQIKFLLTRAKGSTRAVAERLGVSRRTVERYRSGAIAKPQKRLQAALVEETEAERQPQVKAQARQRAATIGGLLISCRAYFGFGPEGTSDAGRVRGHQHRHLALPRRPDLEGEGERYDERRSARPGCGGHRGRLFPPGGRRACGPACGIQGRGVAGRTSPPTATRPRRRACCGRKPVTPTWSALPVSSPVSVPGRPGGARAKPAGEAPGDRDAPPPSWAPRCPTHSCATTSTTRRRPRHLLRHGPSADHNRRVR
ncbi:hypothetical protein FB570_12169 [Streptomyces sp. T12]|nr:hypothetical protein FB570_12169 [Streptomyces sp. T12]